MAPLHAALRSLNLITHLHLHWYSRLRLVPFPSPPSLVFLLPHFSKRSLCTLSYLSPPRCTKPSLNPQTPQSHSPPYPKGNSLILKQDERFMGSTEKTQMVNTTTIAAIVTSLGGPPAAVGIVRLSGPSAVDIAGKVFRPLRNKGKKQQKVQGKRDDGGEEGEGLSLWRPISHVVEYGVVLDSNGNVVDEV